MEQLALAQQTGAGRERRHLHGLTAAAEKRVLIALAERLPPWVTSDHLTMLGLLSAVAIGAAFALTPLWSTAPLLVVPLLILNWFGDSLDGTLARVRRLQRPRYGFYVDHVVDVTGMAAIGAGLAASGLMSPMLGLAVGLAYVLLAAESFLATHTLGTFRVSYGPFGPTELRIVLGAGAIRAAIDPWIALGAFELRLFDVGGAIAVVGMAAVFAAAALRNTRTLYRDDPLPSTRHNDAE